MVTIAIAMTSSLLRNLHLSDSDFYNSGLFAVPTRKSYLKKSSQINHIPLLKNCREPPLVIMAV